MKKIMMMLFLSAVLAIPAFSADQNSMQKDALTRLYGSVSRITVADIKTVMITPFEYSKDITLKTAEDAVAATLAKTGKYKVIDKKSLKELVEQQKYSISGLTDETEARKIGKLLSADAVLFGSVSISGEVMVITLSLRDVATGALLWSDRFEGEDLTRIYFGPGLRSGFFSASMPITLTLPVTLTQVVAQPLDINNGFFFAFSFSYVQRMPDVKAVSFGLDGIFYRGFAQFDDLTKTGIADGASSYTFTAKGSYTDLKLNLCALVRIHLGPLLDMGSDFLILYAGPGLDGNYMLADATYNLKQTAGGVYASGDVGYTKQIGQALAFGGVTFRIGLEMRFTPAFSVFVEAYSIPSFTYNFNDVNVPGGAGIDPKLTIGAGNNFYGLGMRYLIF